MDPFPTVGHLKCTVKVVYIGGQKGGLNEPPRTLPSGGFRNSERGVQPLACEARAQIFGLPRPLSVMLEVQTEYLEATLGLVKCLEINKELIRECVTMPGCCCCMPLLHNHLIDSCSYVRKNTLLAAKGGCICTPLTPPESATAPCLQACIPNSQHCEMICVHCSARSWY